MKLILALTAALLPALAAAAEPDAVQLSFERDLAREPVVQAVGPAQAQEDALAEAIQAAVHGPDQLADSASHRAARACRGG
jgi:hypothetical protein